MNARDEIESVRETYIQWLYSKVGGTDRKYNHFWRVIRRLHQREFYFIVPNDVNRVEDGKALRGEFADEYQYDVNLIVRALDFPCTMLEMLVAFAVRIDSDIMWDPDVGDRSAYWFWKMLENAGLNLKKFSDENFDENCIFELEELINRVVSRHYNRHGEGGLFPVMETKKDLRRVELWYQMHFWIAEKF